MLQGTAASSRSRSPCFHRRIRSCTTRQRLPRRWIGAIRRRWWSAWVARCGARVRSAPRGVFVGMRIATWGSVHARQRESYPPPAGSGEGGPPPCAAPAPGRPWCRGARGAGGGHARAGPLCPCGLLASRSHALAVQQRLGGGRSAVPSRQGPPGGLSAGRPRERPAPPPLGPPRWRIRMKLSADSLHEARVSPWFCKLSPGFARRGPSFAHRLGRQTFGSLTAACCRKWYFRMPTERWLGASSEPTLPCRANFRRLSSQLVLRRVTRVCGHST